MTKRRITKASKRRLAVFGTLSIVFIIFFAFSLLYNLYTIYDLTSEKHKLETFYVELQEEADKLKIDIEKLNDPEYLAKYAREKFLYSKDGEYIIQMSEDVTETSDSINAINIELKKNYVIIALSILMILIFVYILTKSKRKQKNKRK